MFVVPKKRYDRVVEEKNNEIENLKKRIKHLESEGELKTKKLNETTYKLNFRPVGSTPCRANFVVSCGISVRAGAAAAT